MWAVSEGVASLITVVIRDGVKGVGLHQLTPAKESRCARRREQQIGRLAAQRGYTRALIRHRLRAATSVCI